MGIRCRITHQPLNHGLGAAVQRGSFHGLVRGHTQHALDAGIYCRLHDIGRTRDIRGDRFQGIVCTGINLLECSEVIDLIHAMHCTLEPIFITHIAKEEA
ncbi:MAG: hypothetical protein JW384_01621 [Nitrosomonadaceae bacterium]|nr:hypothetical protein [Nitrosomonadaceae bacterium]